MKNKYLIKLLKKIYPLLVLEDVISHEKRVFLKKILGYSSVLLFLLALFSHGAFISQIKGFFCLTFFGFLWTFFIECYFYSNYESTDNQNNNVPFEVARMLFYSDDGDLTKGFLFSDIGDEVMKRLEFTETEIRDFLQSREDTIISFPDKFKKGFSFIDYLKVLFEADVVLQELLLKKNIKYEDLENAFIWVIKKTEDKIEKERFWSREHLSKIEGIGKNWSYGETYLLERYGRDITSIGLSHFEGYQSMHSKTVSKLESILCRSSGANAVVISQDEASRMDVVTILAKKIKEGKILSPLFKKRVYVIDTNLLIEDSKDKLSFERNFNDVLQQSEEALNVIVVIPYFSIFLKSALNIGSDALSILRPFFLSTSSNFIMLDSKEAFQNELSQNASITENFEIVQVEMNDQNGTLVMLEEEAEKIELESKFIFSYKALKAIVEGVKRYFDSFSLADKARDILIESVPYSASLGERLITEATILDLINSKTGIPTVAPKGEEKDTLLHLEEILHKRVVGQNEAIKAISDALRRSRAGVNNPDRPIGSFLFLGPTGVGKTETTKALAHIFFGSEDNISRFDMSEYQTADSVAKLIGSFGLKEQGLLVTRLHERPYGVVLLDEFEKTNKEVLNLFLQVLDEGQFADSTGKNINAKNTIFIATSNAGSELLWQYFKEGKNINEHKSEIIDAIISEGIFKPELLNRFDGVVLFHPLEDEHLKKVAIFMVQKLTDRMKEKSIIVESSDELIRYLVQKGSDPKFGARPMNRAIQNELEQLIAEKIINGEVTAGSHVSFGLDKENVLKVKVK